MKKTASNASIWTKCDGYIKAAGDYIREYGHIPSPSAEEGMMAHALAEPQLKRLNCVEDPDLSFPEKLFGKIVSADMKVKVAGYIRSCHSCLVRARDTSGYSFWVEERIDCTFLDEKAYARVDFACYIPDHRTLIVYDLKYGHRPVPAKENPQLLIGARAIMDALEEDGYYADVINLVIYAPNGPRAYIPADEWIISRDELFSRTSDMVNKYHNDGDDLIPGNHCYYCEARGLCTALERANFTNWGVLGDYNEIPQGLPVKAIERRLAEVESMSDLLRAYRTGLEAMTVAMLKRGIEFPKWEYSSNQSARKWAYPEEHVIELGRSLGIELENKTIISPKQAELAGMPKEVVNTMVHRETTGLKLRKKSTRIMKQRF